MPDNPTAGIDAFLGLPDRNANPGAWNAAVGANIGTFSGQSREELVKRAMALQAQLFARPQEPMTVKGGNVGPNQPSRRDVLLQRAKDAQERLFSASTFARGPQDRAGTSTGMQAMTRSGVQRVAQNALNLATFVPNTAMNIANLPARLFRHDTNPWMPANPIHLSASPVMAGIDMLGEFAGAVKEGDSSFFSKNPVEQAQVRSEGMRDDHPIAWGAGQIAGDVASLLALRSPVAGARGRAQWDFRKGMERASIEGTALKPFAPSVSHMFKRIAKDNHSLQWMTNRAGRAVEAGIEGAAIAIMNGGDPVETAMWTSGIQLGGGVATQLTSSIFSGGTLSAGAKLSLAAAGTFGVLFGLKQAIPGEDLVWKTIEDSYEKVAAVLGLGMVSGIAGAGRITNPKLTATIADQITAALRGGTFSVLTEAREDNRIETVIEKVRISPDYFGRNAMIKLEKAFTSPDVSMTKTIDDLMDSDNEFKRKYIQLERLSEQR